MDFDSLGFRFISIFFFYEMKIREVIFWILVMISIGVVLWFFLGKSPTFEQTILISLTTVIFGIGIKIAIIGEKMNSMEKKFNLLAHDFKQHISAKYVKYSLHKIT